MLTELDGKTVRQQDRKYLMALATRKRFGRSQSLGASDKKEKRANSYQGNFAGRGGADSHHYYAQEGTFDTNNGSMIGGTSDFNNGTGAVKKKVAPGNKS